MPMLTPSRVAVVVISLSLFSFLWTWGLPRELPQPGFPIVSHDSTEKSDLYEDKAAWERPKFDFEPEQAQGRKKSKTSTTRTSPTRSPTAIPSDKGKANGDLGKANGTLLANTTSTTASTSSPTPSPTPVRFCKDVHGAPNVMVIVKTSKAEITDKLPTHLKTLLECVPNFAIFSDHSGKIDGFTVHDALENISNSTRTRHKEFETYETLQTAKDVKSVDKELDKWKFLPMVYKAYKMRPYSRFYIFIEADTSLSWTNLLQWINRLDYRIPYYSGAPTFIGSTKYAQRGPGILISHGAMRQYAKAYDERYTNEWEKRVGKECCGDMVLATAMVDAHVEFYSAWPLLQGETPSTLDWTERHWCAPVVSWHHMAAPEIETLWNQQKNFTAKHGWEEPYLFRAAFKEFIAPALVDHLDEWDNLSQDTKIAKPKGDDDKEKEEWDKHGDDIKKAVESWEDCRHVCDIADDCVQWKFRDGGKVTKVVRREEGEKMPKEGNEGQEEDKPEEQKPPEPEKIPGECYLGKTIMMGKKLPKKDGEEPWVSGWMTERIRKNTEKWDSDCKEPKWRFNQ
jgi:hypothetical protein